MNAQQDAIARACLSAAHDGSMSFPEAVGALIAAGFEGYAVDYRCGTTTYYLPNGDSLVLESGGHGGAVAERFDDDGVAACVREAQANAPGYTYPLFCEKVKASGCAGYLVSFSGRRVVYYGRTAETHVEFFP
ncbi:DUF1398 domain-containing protein [Microbaculum marinum]|uniref:DUF1398 domain-containing protein n=1 Tax=Microbaculum marinum TaxID=1764581 RepID=A0AAW9RQR2_9HYPH